MYIVYTMNYTTTRPANGNGKSGNEAAILASLTRDLAHCCLHKESELFSRFGLTSSEGVVLLQVAETGKTLPSSLACVLGLARSRLTPLSASLVEKGFLHRKESETDRRVRELTLTEKGETVAVAARGCRLDFHQRLLERYSENERTQLLSTLTSLRETMDELRQQMTTESTT
jgi:DNA-binding MarR family transcriptional regulator